MILLYYRSTFIVIINVHEWANSFNLFSNKTCYLRLLMEICFTSITFFVYGFMSLKPQQANANGCDFINKILAIYIAVGLLAIKAYLIAYCKLVCICLLLSLKAYWRCIDV